MNLKIKFELEETELNGEIENLIPSSSGGSLPSGGTTGQVLTKNSDADGDAGWKDAVQADWNEDDETSPTYVKNRTHYTQTEELPLTYDSYHNEGTHVDTEDLNKKSFKINGTIYEKITPTSSSWYQYYACGDYTITVDHRATTVTCSPEAEAFFIANVIHKISLDYIPDDIINNIATAKETADDAKTIATRAETQAEKNRIDKNDRENPISFGTLKHGKVDTKYVAEATGSNAVAFGYAKATGDFSFAQGYNLLPDYMASTTASGLGSHAEGENTLSSARGSHSEGIATYAVGDYSHSEGKDTHAQGYASHAEGDSTWAYAYASHSEGRGTSARGTHQHSQGRYNIEDPDSKLAFITGNGTDKDNRSNAHTLDWDGNGWYAGDVYVGSTSGKNKDSGSVKLAREDNAVLVKSQTLTTEQQSQALANIGGLSKNQGTSNSGKFLGIGADGIVVPTEVGGGSEWVTLFNGTIATEEAVNSMSADLLKSCEGMNEFLVWYTNTKNTVETPGNDNSEVTIGKANYGYGRFGDLSSDNEKIVHLLLTDSITYSYVIGTRENSMQYNAGTGTGGWSSNKANPDYNKVKISCFNGTYIGTISLKIYGR